MEENKKKHSKKVFFSMLIIFPLLLVSTIIQYTAFSSKFFTDGTYILSLMENNVERKGTAFYYTAEIFKFINIFRFNSLLQWSILLSIIFGTITFMKLIRNKNYSFFEYIFIFTSISLLKFYVFNLGKDIIQFIIFMMIDVVILNRKMKEEKKAIIISVILLIESITFRPYYILIFLGFIIGYGIYYLYQKNITGVKLLVLSILGFLILLILSQFIVPSKYKQVIEVRDHLSATLNVNTEIHNLISMDNFLSFSLNYLINMVRILFPIELIIRRTILLSFYFLSIIFNKSYFV